MENNKTSIETTLTFEEELLFVAWFCHSSLDEVLLWKHSKFTQFLQASMRLQKKNCCPMDLQMRADSYTIAYYESLLKQGKDD